jgi:NifB/MoaA-like Fe-S oxidoreductase
VEREATIVTGSVARPFLSAIFQELGARVNVVSVNKDVGCLITIDDLRGLSLEEVKGTVVIPGRTLAFDREMEAVLSRDGRDRRVLRGPERLTVDGEMSISMSRDDVIDLEIEAFKELIEMINAMGD